MKAKKKRLSIRNGSFYGADNIWEDILLKGVEEMKKNGYKKNLVVFEVGAHAAKQSLTAAKQKFHAHSVEPSPPSFNRIKRGMIHALAKDASVGEFIHLYNFAAGSQSGGMLDFKTTGGTGDHVGEFDVWNMKAGKDPDHYPDSKKGKMVQIPSIKLDDIVYYNKVRPTSVKGLESGSNPPEIEHVWAIKVDTQGFEPQVFAGLKESIKARKFQYVLTEYWPNGIGLLNNSMDNKCQLAVEMLTRLDAAGYKIYALPAVAHPKGKEDQRVLTAMSQWSDRPLHDAEADCQYFLDFEKRFPNPNYHMGFWTDFLAIAPGAEPIIPKTFGAIE